MSRATDLELFSAIAKSGSLSEAARRLGLTAGAVSRRLAAMETRLGCPLVLRNTRGMALTGEGFSRARTTFWNGLPLLKTL